MSNYSEQSTSETAFYNDKKIPNLPSPPSYLKTRNSSFNNNINDSNIEETTQPEFTEEDVRSLFNPTESRLPDKIPVNPLQKPICLPQINSSFDSPILRAYPPSLESVGISRTDWLAFCDGLNIALIASPPLQIVDMVGAIIGFVPHHWAIIAGVLIQTAAQTTIHILSKTLTDKYLLHANTTFFQPRGITVRLIRTPALRQLLQIDASTLPPSKFLTVGKKVLSAAETLALHLPIIRKVVVAFSKPAPAIDVDSGLGLTERRLEMMEGKIAELDLDVPKPKIPEALLDKASDLSIKLRKWKSGRKETAANRKRTQLANFQGLNGNSSRNVSPRQGIISTPISMARNYIDSNRSDSNSSSPVQSRSRREEARMIGRRRGGNGRNGGGGGLLRRSDNKHLRKLEMKVKIEDRKEWKQNDSLIWLCVLNKKEDSKILGREVADSPADFEVSQEEWEEVIEQEVGAEQEGDAYEQYRF